MAELSDERLMDDAMAGDRQALAVLIERYHGQLLMFALRMMATDRTSAEDVVQEAFVRVMTQHTFQNGRRVKPWLYRITSNLIHDHFRSVTATRNGDGLLERQPAEGDGPEAATLLTDTALAVRAAVSALPLEQRATVILRFYQDLSLQEIAEALDVPVGTVKSRLFNGTRRLKDLMIVEESK